MKVADLMTRHVEFVEPEASVQDAAALMGELDISALPVGSAEDLKGISRTATFSIVSSPKVKIRDAHPSCRSRAK